MPFACSLQPFLSVWQEKNINGELPEVLLEKLILAGQSILSTIADLKRTALLSDFPALNHLIRNKTEEHDASRIEAEAKIQQLMIEKDSQVAHRFTFQSSCLFSAVAYILYWRSLNSETIKSNLQWQSPQAKEFHAAFADAAFLAGSR